jgi:hypothetical protein
MRETLNEISYYISDNFLNYFPAYLYIILGSSVRKGIASFFPV